MLPEAYAWDIPIPCVHVQLTMCVRLGERLGEVVCPLHVTPPPPASTWEPPEPAAILAAALKARGYSIGKEEFQADWSSKEVPVLMLQTVARAGANVCVVLGLRSVVVTSSLTVCWPQVQGMGQGSFTGGSYGVSSCKGGFLRMAGEAGQL